MDLWWATNGLGADPKVGITNSEIELYSAYTAVYIAIVHVIRVNGALIVPDCA